MLEKSQLNAQRNNATNWNSRWREISYSYREAKRKNEKREGAKGDAGAYGNAVAHWIWREASFGSQVTQLHVI